jgi:hypothetical protein
MRELARYPRSFIHACATKHVQTSKQGKSGDLGGNHVTLHIQTYRRGRRGGTDQVAAVEAVKRALASRPEQRDGGRAPLGDASSCGLVILRQTDQQTGEDIIRAVARKGANVQTPHPRMNTPSSSRLPTPATDDEPRGPHPAESAFFRLQGRAALLTWSRLREEPTSGLVARYAVCGV